jgi:large subunit ribosomal protein L1
MARRGKKYTASREKVQKKVYSLQEAVPLVKEAAFAKFDETVEIHMQLGVNPKHADQMVRGTIVLPHGTGKTKRIAVIAAGEKVKEAEGAGADIVGGEELVTRIQNGFLDFDAVIATPDMMKLVGKLGKILGPRGVMPNPKTGTVTFDVREAVQEIKGGRIEFRVDKTATMHAPIGRVSFDPQKLVENASAFILAVLKAKPAAAKGKYLRSVFLASTMGPSVKINSDLIEAGASAR